MSKKSKTKGSSFERSIAKSLSLWLSDGERSDLLWRSAMSGGAHTVAAKRGSDASSMAGDLSSIDKLSHDFIEYFLVELKCYKNLNLQGLFYGSKTGITQFYQRALKDAKAINKHPLLIVKQDFQSILVCSTPKGYSRLFGNKNRYKIATFPGKNLVVFDYDSLLNYGVF